MAPQFHSKICAHAHNAMEGLYGAGLIDPQSMSHFNVLCRSDATAQAPSHPPAAPWLVELRAEFALAEKNYAPVLTAKVMPAPQPARATSIKAPTASASHVAAASTSSMRTKKEVQAQASRPVAATRPAPIARAPSPAAKREPPKAPIPSAQPKPRAVLPKAEDWQFPQGARTFQSAAAQPAPAGTFKQSPPRQRSAAELRQLREREGVSEAVFARCLGVPPQTVIAWEDGTVLPSPKVSRMLASIEEKGLNAVG